MTKTKDYELKIQEVLTECTLRRNRGAVEYGEDSFYQKDNLTELQEELYDVINYALFTILQVEKIKEKAKKLNLLNIQ